jgi:3-methyladenine DNA glycosylase AlkC
MAELLKDRYMTTKSLNEFASILIKLFPTFDREKFIELVHDSNWKNLELKERMRHVTICLHELMPDNYEEAIDILKKAAPDVKGFEAITLPDYTELYGLDRWDISMPALKLYTQYSTSEFGIRPYLIQDLKRAMELMYECSDHEHENVRRFASEGCRPRLPWAMAVPELKKDPTLILPILKKLKDDPSEFVRKSVSNSLNDISKDNPDIVLDLAEKWFGKSKNTDKIIKHALRTLLKAGDRRALILFGFADPKNLNVFDLQFGSDTVKIGDFLNFNFTLLVDGNSETKVRLEYAIYFVKASGKLSKKVFQIGEKSYKPGDHKISRKYDFADKSTRKHHPGEHQLAIIVNGVEKEKKAIMVEK